MRGDPTKAIGIRIPLRLIPTLEEDAAARGTGLSAHLAGIIVDHVEGTGRAYARTLRREEDTPDPIPEWEVGAITAAVEQTGHRHRRQHTGQVKFERGAKVEHAVCATCGQDLGWR